MQNSLTAAQFGGDVFLYTIGVIVFAAGVVSCILFLLRTGRTDRSALYFGLASIMYGLGLFLQLQTLHRAYPTPIWDIANWCVTYLLLIPFFLGCVPIIANYPRLVRVVVTVQIVLALVGIPSVIAGFMPGHRLAQLGTSAVGTSLIVLLIYMALFPDREVDHEGKVLRSGLLIFGFFGFCANVQAFYNFAILEQLAAMLPAGYFVVLCCFGYASARRTLKMEQKLSGIESELEIA